MQNWIDPVACLPEKGTEVIGYNKEWIDLDFNPDGTSMCFLNADDSWAIAAWDSEVEEWQTLNTNEEHQWHMDKEAPTHWMHKPKPPHESGHFNMPSKNILPETEELQKPFLSIMQPFKASVMGHLGNLIKDYSKEQGWKHNDVTMKSEGDLLHLIHIPKP